MSEASTRLGPPKKLTIPTFSPFCIPEAGVGLGIGLCSVPYFQCISGIFVHTLSPGSVAHLDGRLRWVPVSLSKRSPGLEQRRLPLGVSEVGLRRNAEGLRLGSAVAQPQSRQSPGHREKGQDTKNLSNFTPELSIESSVTDSPETTANQTATESKGSLL